MPSFPSIPTSLVVARRAVDARCGDRQRRQRLSVGRRHGQHLRRIAMWRRADAHPRPSPRVARFAVECRRHRAGDRTTLPTACKSLWTAACGASASCSTRASVSARSSRRTIRCWRISTACSGLGFPLLAGTSRKSFVGRTVGKRRGGEDAPADERLYGSLAAMVASILGGAHIVRVHDVRPAVEAAAVADEVLAAMPSVRGATSGQASLASDRINGSPLRPDESSRSQRRRARLPHHMPNSKYLLPILA